MILPLPRRWRSTHVSTVSACGNYITQKPRRCRANEDPEKGRLRAWERLWGGTSGCLLGRTFCFRMSPPPHSAGQICSDGRGGGSCPNGARLLALVSRRLAPRLPRPQVPKAEAALVEPAQVGAAPPAPPRPPPRNPQASMRAVGALVGGPVYDPEFEGTWRDGRGGPAGAGASGARAGCPRGRSVRRGDVCSVSSAVI